MNIQKPALPQGTRDFAPEVMVKRNFILDTIKKTFQKFGFLPLETPAMERLDVLTGKYGEEGNQLIFKILNNGDFLENISSDYLNEGYKKLTTKISEKALRYDLTVPFARFVVMNRGTLTFPFKRYQIQPVWRGDRPAKGRYREFYQCDADVVGTDSLICEAEIILMINEVLNNLKIKDFNLKINNRKILTGIAEVLGAIDKVSDLCVAIDKLDKIGEAKVKEELQNKGFSADALEKLQPILSIKGNALDKLNYLKDLFKNSAIGQTGVKELETVFQLVKDFTLDDNYEQNYHIDFDLTLARGLSYYTGAIFEVKVNNVSIGSISGGGRYDNLTETFGMPDTPGVGFSFGVDRVFDVMEELNLFPTDASTTTQVLLAYFDENAQKYALPILQKIRKSLINSEIYPKLVKIDKQMKYANAKKIPYVILIGSEEMRTGLLSLKNMQSGEQFKLTIEDIIDKISQK